MNTEIIFVVIVVFLVADFVVERGLEWLNMRAMSPVLPAKLKGIYDEQEYGRFQDYKRENNRFSLFSSVFSFVVMLVFLSLGGFGWWNCLVVGMTDNTILQTLLFHSFRGLLLCLLTGTQLFTLRKNMDLIELR